MPEFKTIQTQLQQARKEREAGKKTLFRAKEKLKKLERAKQQLSRRYPENSAAFEALLQQERDLKEAISGHNAQLAEFQKTEADLLEAFHIFTDPRQHIQQFSDDFPVLLFPVRLETRFKKIPIENDVVQHQLWVRIFPDECSIDTFDDTLSEAEVTKAKNYWTNLWKAGTAGNKTVEPFIQNKEKGAWRELMGILNGGRAYWITENYRPVNVDEIPERTSESDVLLIIPTEELPDQPTQDALKDYWQAVFLANGDATKNDAAFTQLMNAIGVDLDQALQLIKAFKPQNIDDEQSITGTPPDVTVSFLVFRKSEEVNTKLTQWSHSARVTTFPDKFVLIGYQAGNSKPIINELGNRIPDPLIVGPDPGEDIDEVLKAAFGNDFEKLPDEKKAAKYVEYLSQQSDTKWLFDFDEAIRIGMGFKVNLSEYEYDQGFEKLFVLGVKLSADQGEGQSALEQLVKNHHYGDSGFSILPQGTPTNNTEEKGSGYSEIKDADDAYSRYLSENTEDDPTDVAEKCDGRWLAEILGIDIQEATLHLTANYYHKDQCEARAMNTALWNATIGYFMESMLTPVFNDKQRDLIRWFLMNHVSGRGRVPAFRVGNQPYGILPVTTLSDLKWISQGDTRFAREYTNLLPDLNDIYTVLKTVREHWEYLLEMVAYVGKEGKDAHKTLLKVLGLHATSVEFDQRYAESKLHLYNLLVSKEKIGEAWKIEKVADKWMYLLKALGYKHDEKQNPEIPILWKFFFDTENDVEKPLIDDQSYSEKAAIRAYTDAGENYIEWLIKNAKNNQRNIKDQKGFTANKKPNALLYDMLRHALNLEFSNSGLKFYAIADILNTDQISAAKIDANFIGIQAEKPEFESKWDLLYREEPLIADTGILVADHISSQLKTGIVNTQTEHLHEVLTALEHLKDTPTARLERAFVEHLDCCSYRLDAWLLGLVNLQLYAMRFGGEYNENEAQKGIYLGAYSWVENLKSEDKDLSSVTLEPKLKKIFDPTGIKNPMKDKTNAGYVHAPSINQALTAAVLRNAYLSHASKDAGEAEIFKVNLSSERVRMALLIIEGMQQGQSLGAMLGYQLERGLHGRTDEELDIYIHELRKVFPLVSNRMTSTEIKVGKTANSAEETKRFQEEEKEFEEDKAITKIEAKNVVDGLSLLKHIEKKGIKTYPFGFPTGKGAGKLKSANKNQREAIDSEVRRLMNIRDAVADLAVAESVHQVVQGNYDRAAGALDAYSKGSYPQTPDVIKTPGSGVSLTLRFGIHLPSGVSPAAGATPRSKAEPAVNKWLEDLFPANLSEICCKVEYRIPNYESETPNASQEKIVTMADLGLLPIDLLYMLDVESEKNLTALDDCILKYVHETEKPRPDVELEIKYTEPIDGKITFFEMAPLIRSLRSLIIAARPLLPTDMLLQSEAVEEQNTSCLIDPDRISKTSSTTAPKQVFDKIRQDLNDDFCDVIEPLINDDDFEITLGNKDQIILQIDTLLGYFITYLSLLNQFGMPQTGFGFIYDRKSDIYAAIYKKVLEYKKRWVEKKDAFMDLMDNQFPAATIDDEKISILQKAERTISTTSSVPVPTIPNYKTILAGKKNDFLSKLAEIETFLNDEFLTIQSLVKAVSDLKIDLDTFDLLTIDTEDEEKQIVVLAEDLKNQAEKLDTAILKKSGTVQNLLDEHNAATAAKDKTQALTQAAKELFGKDFQMVPEFNLDTEQISELQNCLNNQNQLLDFQINTQSNDFPVDDWLYGMARIREKLSAWENLVMLAEGFKDRSALNLTPLQLPFKANDSWLGLEFKDDLEIEGDKLLYTAYMPNFDPAQSQCGLLVDEWTEVIPVKKETTGMTFHYDRPNSEPPQTLLLVTPSEFTGSWKWEDIVNTLRETLDLAKLRAIEPDHLDNTHYAQFLPTTVAAVTFYPVTIALNYFIQANQADQTKSEENE
jgi:hypothetical protein